MILAGVLLKLGAYGLLRASLLVDLKKWEYYKLFFFVLVGGFLASLVCFRQHDLKALVAYSSVVHMGVIVLVLSLKGYLRVVGVVCILISHGVIRRGMFLNVTLFYKLRKSRSVLLKKGLIYYLPLFIFF